MKIKSVCMLVVSVVSQMMIDYKGPKDFRGTMQRTDPLEPGTRGVARTISKVSHFAAVASK